MLNSILSVITVHKIKVYHIGNDILDLMKCDFGYYYLIVFVCSLFLFTHGPSLCFLHDFVAQVHKITASFSP